MKRIAIIGMLLALSYLAFFNHVEPSEVGLERNILTGKVIIQPSGWHVTAPWVQVACIDTRPIRVGVVSAGKGWDAKLVAFEPKEFQEFIKTEGFRYYWWANRFSLNLGYNEEHRGMKDILRGYAYSAKRYPFIVIVEEYKAQ